MIEDVEVVGFHPAFHADKGIAELLATIERLEKTVHWHINHCDKDQGECMQCSVVHCPFSDPLHFHHDGCPSCP